MDEREEVLGAAAAIVAAFGAHDVETYFAGFSPDATFVFHTAEEPLRSRAAYEALWTSWEQETGFHVISCSSSDPDVQLLGEARDVAVFTHRVHTVVRTADGEESVEERETIVLHREPDGRWVAVHEHLSPAPASVRGPG